MRLVRNIPTGAGVAIIAHLFLYLYDPTTDKWSLSLLSTKCVLLDVSAREVSYLPLVSAGQQ